MLKKIGRLFTIKTRFEAWLVIYAIALGAVERGQHYLGAYPGLGGWLLAIACTGVVFVAGGKLHCDIGFGEVVQLPDAETEERWRLTTPQWPVMHAVLRGVSRDQMMARHKSNHIQVAYAPDAAKAKKAMYAKAAAMRELGLKVHFCGVK